MLIVPVGRLAEAETKIVYVDDGGSICSLLKSQGQGVPENERVWTTPCLTC
jgi:hypothetical protein